MIEKKGRKGKEGMNGKIIKGNYQRLQRLMQSTLR